MAKMKMKAPKGTESANIEGHEYEVSKSGIIEVSNANHIETLKRHGFVEYEDPKALLENIDEEEDKDKLVEFIESRGGEADNTMGIKKLRRLAKESLEE